MAPPATAPTPTTAQNGHFFHSGRSSVSWLVVKRSGGRLSSEAGRAGSGGVADGGRNGKGSARVAPGVVEIAGGDLVVVDGFGGAPVGCVPVGRVPVGCAPVGCVPVGCVPVGCV